MACSHAGGAGALGPASSLCLLRPMAAVRPGDHSSSYIKLPPSSGWGKEFLE